MSLRNNLIGLAVEVMERGWVPDSWVRQGIRRLIAQRRRELRVGTPAESRQRSEQFLNQSVEETRLALETDKANEQHYEVPAPFFELVLGPHKKYSSCYFGELEKPVSPINDLGKAESAALQLTCERAGLRDGMRILELGCGWGSLTLWMAEHFPNAEITAVSNSRTQRESILQVAQERGIDQRLTVLTCDINHLELPQDSFDRVVSVEMFEHVRNHKELLQRIAGWLRADGKLFVHIFCHREFAYPFETQGASNWMGRYFFSGGMMPNRDLFARYTDDLKIVQQWDWNGRHYERTSNAWAANMDRNRAAILRLFRECYGEGQEVRWFQRWKMFFLACAELFGAHEGNEWHVSHYLFESVSVHSKTNGSEHIPSFPAPAAR